MQRGRVLHIDYSGPIDLRTIRLLDRLVLPQRMGFESSMEHMDKAMTMFTETTLHRQYWTGWVPPSAVIVRPDQQSASIVFCKNLAKYGILRQTFLQHQEELAQVWAQAAVLLTQSSSRMRS